jgi:hypothetical protein
MPLKLSRNDSELAQNDHQVGHILSPGGLVFRIHAYRLQYATDVKEERIQMR